MFLHISSVLSKKSYVSIQKRIEAVPYTQNSIKTVPYPSRANKQFDATNIL